MGLQEKLSVLKQLDAEIVDLVSEDAVTDEIEQSDAFMEEIFALLVKLEPPVDPTPARGGTLTSSARPVDHLCHDKVKLPKLTIQPFKGDLTNWTTFWDSYQAAIDDNASISKIDKFNYLRSLLQGPALDAIAGLTLTAANYQEAISVLKVRFGNKQQIVARHMDALLAVSSVTSDFDLQALRRLYDVVESQVRGLRSLGVAPDSYGSLLSSVLLSKLPQEIRLIISRKVGDGDWELERLMKMLQEEVQARERAGASEATPIRRATRSPSTASTLLTGGSGSTPTCCYCHQTHFSHTCQNVEALEDRRRILRESGRCFVCLRRGHIVRQCLSKNRCPQCQGRHHGSICDKKELSSEDARSKSTEPTEDSAATTLNIGVNPAAPPFHPPTSTALWTSGNETVLLQTAKALVFNPNNAQHSKKIRIVLDSGSQRSYITEQLRKELSLEPHGEQGMRIMTFGSREEVSRVCDVVNVCMVVRGGRTRQLTLYAVPIICEPLACQPITLCQAHFKHLAGLPLADQSDGKDCLSVDILIGSDLYWSLLTGKTRRGESGPVGIDTELGWVLSGPVGIPVHGQNDTALVTHTLHVESLLRHDAQALDERLQTFWNLESFGVTAPDRSVLDEFLDQVCFVQGRYEVCLPWKDPHQILSDNRQLSLRRLHGLLRRLKQNKEILTEYDAVIKNQINHGVVEVVECSEEKGERIHYLPHHAIVRHDKDTTKIRVVYDASARSSGPSLNECLHAGPKFEQRILDLLLRFRVHKVALIADIEKAFLMVSMAPRDRDVLRLFWVDDIGKEQPDLLTLRFTRVVFGVSASPFLLNATIRHHLESYRTSQADTIEKLLRSFYVDDVVTGASDENAAYMLYQASKEILKEGGFNLRKFCSNSTLLQMMIDKQELSDTLIGTTTSEVDETYASATLGYSQEHHFGERKVLGVRWDITTDQIVMSLDGIASAAMELQPTKRSIVSLVGKIYDPMGLLSPVVIRFKIFLQELCEAKLDWDEPLTDALQTKWRQMSQGLHEGQPMFIPRCFVDQREVKAYELCGFCDSSLKAYAAVVYLRTETLDGYQVSLVASKTRVSPLKQQTIPRLELLSALLLSRLMFSVSQALQSEVQLSKHHCFTDSTVALHWILGVDKSWKPFVQNRVAEVRTLFPPLCWSHCAGRDNPADIPSRGFAPQELADSQLWANGPIWLRMGDFSRSADFQMPEECLVEMKQEVAHGLLATDSEDPSSIEQLMNCKDYSSLHRLMHVTAHVLRFSYTLLSKVRSKAKSVTSNLMATAERLWLAASQRSLVNDKNFTEWKSQFGLFQDEAKIWHCGGRIQHADLPASTIHPVLLSRNHPLTMLYVRQAHERVLHNGVKSTLTELRSRFWVVRGRSLVRQILRQCTICKRFEGQPYRAPPPPPLPAFRVREAPPFTHTGVDFAGPLYVKEPSSGSSSKVWICLYTCCVTHAVHLDLVPDLSTEAFLRSFKRFAARRGVPAKLVSDNGKTFKAAAKLIRAVVSHKDVQHYLSGLGVQWIFNLGQDK